MIVAVILATIYLLLNIESEKKEDLYVPLRSIADKQDSIHEEMRLFREKYKPVEIKSKSYKNSSFFNADKVDSVQIKLYQGKPLELNQ